MDEQKVMVEGSSSPYTDCFCVTEFWHWDFLNYLGASCSRSAAARYLLAGLAYLIIAVGYFTRSQYALPLAVITFLLTLVWALYEVQLSYWGLIPRLVVPALMLMLALWLAAAMPVARVRLANWSATVILSRCWRRWFRRSIRTAASTMAS